MRMRLRPLVVCLATWLALACGVSCAAASATPFALPGSAFLPRAECPLDPVPADDLQRLEQRLRGQCRASTDGRRWTDMDGSGSRGALRLGQQMGIERGSLVARLRWRLRATVDGTVGAEPLSAQAEVATGLWWQPARDWAVQLRQGLQQQAGMSAHSALLMGAWQMAANRMLYFRWTETSSVSAARIGLRWWLVPQRVLFDLTLPASGLAESPLRLQLNWRGFSL